MNFGDLVPVCVKEVLPSDRIKISTELLIKLAPLASPVMHRLNAYVHYFFVPNFQVSNIFEKFICPKLNTGADASHTFSLPFLSPSFLSSNGKIGSGSSATFIGSLCDYMGLPITQLSWTSQTAAQGGYVNVLPFMCYQHIYNSYYRDQNLEPLEDASAGNTTLYLVDSYKDRQGDFSIGIPSNQLKNLLKIRKRSWAKDYFTSALPSPQAGDDVLLPITSTVNIERDGAMTFEGDPVAQPTVGSFATWQSLGLNKFGLGTGSLSNSVFYESGLKGTAVNSSATINDLRIAVSLQRFKEIVERGGGRYSEMVRNLFGAYLPDYWVDRPIFLGGQKLPIKIGEVIQTSQNDAASSEYLGSRAGIGSGFGYTKSAYLKSPCHGYLIGILSIRPDIEYIGQGLERMWTRKSLYDFAFPQFAHLGEQEIYQRELFATGTESENNTIFGYTPRYAEYKHGHGHICGEFRTTLKDWHFAREFSNAPTLSREFVMMDTVRYDPFNVTSGQSEHVYVNLINHIHARRPLPYYGTPGLL